MIHHRLAHVALLTIVGASLGVAVGRGSLWWIGPLIAVPLAVIVRGRQPSAPTPLVVSVVVTCGSAAAIGAATYAQSASGAANAALIAALVVAVVEVVGARRTVRRLEQAEQDSNLRAALVEERSLLAGEIHDRLGHRLSVAALRIGQLELDPRLDPEQQAVATQVRTDLADVCDDLWQAIRLLDDGQQIAGPPCDPHDVVAAHQRDGGRVDADLDATDDLDESTRDVVGRALRELLANARRHAPDSSVTVSARRDRQDLHLRVHNPVSHVPVESVGGTGLPRLRQRVDRAGGTVDVQGHDGFTVVVTVPLQAPRTAHVPSA